MFTSGKEFPTASVVFRKIQGKDAIMTYKEHLLARATLQAQKMGYLSKQLSVSFPQGSTYIYCFLILLITIVSFLVNGVMYGPLGFCFASACAFNVGVVFAIIMLYKGRALHWLFIFLNMCELCLPVQIILFVFSGVSMSHIGDCPNKTNCYNISWVNFNVCLLCMSLLVNMFLYIYKKKVIARVSGEDSLTEEAFNAATASTRSPNAPLVPESNPV